MYTFFSLRHENKSTGKQYVEAKYLYKDFQAVSACDNFGSKQQNRRHWTSKFPSTKHTIFTVTKILHSYKNVKDVLPVNLNSPET